MKIEYKIIGFDESLGQITISPNGYNSFALDIPISSDGHLLHGEELANYIEGFLPYSLANRKELIGNVGIQNAEEISKLVELPVEATLEPVVPPEPTNDEKWASMRIERNKRLAMTDWIEIPSVRARRSPEWAAAWDAYRQELRDFPEKITDINNIVWAIPPE